MARMLSRALITSQDGRGWESTSDGFPLWRIFVKSRRKAQRQREKRQWRKEYVI